MNPLNYIAMLFAFPLIAIAGPYAEFGLSHSFGSCMYDGYSLVSQSVTIGCSDSPLGSVAIGYRHKAWSIEAYHISSLVETDKGLNLVSIKYRIGK